MVLPHPLQDLLSHMLAAAVQVETLLLLLVELAAAELDQMVLQMELLEQQILAVVVAVRDLTAQAVELVELVVQVL
jgi:hypothetical protein